MVNTRGVWKSVEVLTYQYKTEESSELRSIFEYRHKLVEKFVLEIQGQGGLVTSTRLITQVADRGTREFPVTFEIILEDIPEGTLPVRWANTSNLDYIVKNLFSALQAERQLHAAKEEVARNSFF